MTRLKNHVGFAVRFIGLGYVALWPVSTPGNGELFGAGLLCGGRVADALDLVCRMPHPLRLGVGLHAFGTLCAVMAVSRLLVRAVGRLRSRRSIHAVAAEAIPVSAQVTARPRVRRRRTPPPRKLARARAHFGLRGVPE